jgi:phage portal protein BeeE
VVVNLDGFANPAAGERYNSYAVALAAGILTVDEVRALEGLPPLAPSEQPEPADTATENGSATP